eukprot:bmy_14708T0
MPRLRVSRVSRVQQPAAEQGGSSVAGGRQGPEGLRAPGCHPAASGPGVAGLPRPDLARTPSQPVLPTPACGTHGLAIAAPPKYREVWLAAEVSTIETRKRAAFAEGRVPETAERARGVAAGVSHAARVGKRLRRERARRSRRARFLRERCLFWAGREVPGQLLRGGGAGVGSCGAGQTRRARDSDDQNRPTSGPRGAPWPARRTTGV